ncbi:MAG: hypothetical protein ACTSRI_04350 [Promethearchaeota archaeon]
MSNAHNYSFFGQNTGLIIHSSSKLDPFLFIRSIKKKSNGSWEKPSVGEGKLIKCSLEEIVMILQVLNREMLNWTSYHSYKDNKTTISFSWEDEKAKTFWINIANYSKMLNFAQAEILKLLLNHLLKEKIKHATSLKRKNVDRNNFFSKEAKFIKNNGNYMKDFKENNNQNSNREFKNDKFEKKKTSISNISKQDQMLKDMSTIKGFIKGETEKALLINFNSGNEKWIPKSTIHCQYALKKKAPQKFLIDNWILKKNKMIL